jgi:peptide/nickel transport system ATP-binding protein
MSAPDSDHQRQGAAPAVRPLLQVQDLAVDYAIAGNIVHAVSGVSFALARGETLGLVGESGCGKSTLARAILQLTRVASGQVVFDGVDLTTIGGAALRQLRRRLQIIFQDPIASLNPRRRVADILADPLLIAGVSDKAERSQRIDEVLTAVGLEPSLVLGRFAHEFSGGQCQRLCIARALILEPELIVCDEPVSSLDVSIRAQIINLLEAMKQRYGLTLLFIAHDLAVVKAVSDRVAVMYLGKLAELAPTEQLFRAPGHPYTALLLQAIPQPDPEAAIPEHVAVGEPPSPLSPPSGCRFRTRCSRAQRRCGEEEPPLAEIAPQQWVACHFPLRQDSSPRPGADRRACLEVPGASQDGGAIGGTKKQSGRISSR